MRLTIDGLELAFEVHGEGEPLLWVHGFMGAGADWRYLFPEPPAGYRVIAPDLRGHGASAVPGGAFTFRDCARDLAALLDHLGLARIKAIGLSGGGIALLHLATMRPGLIEAMTLISAPPSFPPQARAQQRQFSLAALPEAERALLRQRHTGGEVQLEWLAATARGFADSVGDVEFTPATLGTIAASTLIVFGDRDPLYPVSQAVELFTALPHAYLWIIPNGGHCPIFGSASSQFVDTSLAFLNGNFSHQA